MPKGWRPRSTRSLKTGSSQTRKRGGGGGKATGGDGLNEDFNPDVDGFESFAMNDGSVCAWKSGQFRYQAQR
jgi:hypothetical protein